MARAVAIAFVGRQNSGKTTLLEALIAELVARGVHLGSLKHHSHAGFDFDIAGKDSWRHRQAGSSYTVVAAPDQLATVTSLERELEAHAIIEMMINNAEACGLPLQMILVEGYKQAKLPTVELFRSGNPKDDERELGDPEATSEHIAVVSNIERVRAAASARELAVFDFTETKGIADLLIQKYLR